MMNILSITMMKNQVEAYQIAHKNSMNIIQAGVFIIQHRSHRSHSKTMAEDLEKSFLLAINVNS